MAKFIKFLNFTRISAIGLFRFLLKNWYLFILILVLLPTIIGSVSQAIIEKNPIIPVIDLGLVLVNADSQIAEDVEILKENPQELIGMEKPTAEIWSGIKYKFAIFKVILREFGFIWAIFFPFVVIFKVLKHRNQSESGKNVFLTIIYGSLLITFVNMVMIINGLLTGSLVSTVAEGVEQNALSWLVILKTLPFHGLLNLLGYLVTLAG